MILNFYDLVIINISDELVTEEHFIKFVKPGTLPPSPKYLLSIYAVDKIDVTKTINISVYMKYDEERIYLCDRNDKICESLFGLFSRNQVNINCEIGFSYSDILAYIVKPYLRFKLIENGMAFIHASSFVYDDKGYVIAAWAHTGKTGTLLAALKNGAKFMGDDLTVVNIHGEILPYPVPINIFDYNLKQGKGLLIKKRLSSRIKMGVAGLIANVFLLLNKTFRNPKMKYLFYAGSIFFQNSAHVAVFSEAINGLEEYQGKIKIHKFVLLERGEKLRRHSVENVDNELISKRLQQCIHYEFQRFNELYTSAQWVPYYKRENSVEEKEMEIYKECLSECGNTFNEIVPDLGAFKEYFAKLIK